MKNIFSSYYNRLIVLTLILSLVPILTISSYLYFNTIDEETKNLQQQLIISSQSGAEDVSLWIDERKNDVQDIAKNELVIRETKNLFNSKLNEESRFITKLNLEKQLQTSVHSYTWLDELRIVDPISGEIIFSTNLITPTLNHANEKHFQEAVNKKIGSSDIFPARIIIENEFDIPDTNVPIILISTPISGEVGLVGILTARIDATMLDSTVKNYVSGFKTIDTYLVNSDGFFISEPKFQNYLHENNLIKSRASLEALVIDPITNQFTKIFKNVNHENIFVDLKGYRNYKGSYVVGSIVGVPETNWHYITEIDRNEAFIGIDKLEILLLTVISIIVLTIIAISLLFAEKLVRPIKRLSQIVEKFDLNEFQKTAYEFEKVNGKDDEVSTLYRNFKTMTESIQKSTTAIKFAEQKYRSLYDDLPDLCRTINKDGIILDCNKAYAKNLGYQKHEIIGKSIFEHSPYGSIQDLRKSFSAWRKQGSVYNREIRMRRKDGSVLPALISATNLYDVENRLIGSNSIIKDISEIQTLIQVEKAKDEFASMISHELKTPLIPIMGYCEMLKDPQFFGKLSDAQIEAINEIYDNSLRLNNLVSEVLMAQRLELNKLQIHKNSFNVGEFLDQVYKSHIQMMIPKEIIFTKDCRIPELTLTSDKNRLMEVFTNLIQNAVDFVPEKNGKIEVGVINEENIVRFYVHDNGVGISPDKISKLFTKFYQIDTSFSRKHGGSGLGLVICKGIINALDGEIKVESEIGKGTTFSFTIPKDDGVE